MFSVLLTAQVAAQPFSLEEKIKPFRLELKNDPQWKGAKGIIGTGKLSEGGDYFYVKGASMFQPIDVFLVGPNAADAHLEVVKHTWKDVELKGNTSATDDGIVNLKLRTYGDFGIRVYSPKDKGDYQVIVYASPEVRKQLPSPFVKASAAAAAVAPEPAGKEKEATTRIPLLLAGAVIVVLLGVIVFLVRSKKGKATLLLLPTLLLLQPSSALAQNWQTMRTLEELKEIAESKNAENILKKVKELKTQAESIKEFLDSYTGIGECMDLPMPPGMPSVPSFCPDDGEGFSSVVTSRAADCADCFVTAREEFERIRYNLEQLRIIYSCTQSFAKKAIALGDNMSGVHAVSGMVWQVERVNIEESVTKMKSAYDQKYNELMPKLQDAMFKLAECEEQFGTPDWYDRYGYMFYEFVKEKYKRSGD